MAAELRVDRDLRNAFRVGRFGIQKDPVRQRVNSQLVADQKLPEGFSGISGVQLERFWSWGSIFATSVGEQIASPVSSEKVQIGVRLDD